LETEKKHIIKFVWVNTCRFLLATLFIFSGFVKAVDPLGSFYKIQDYLAAFGIISWFPTYLPLLFAIILSSAEFCVGVFLFFGGLELGNQITGHAHVNFSGCFALGDHRVAHHIQRVGAENDKACCGAQNNEGQAVGDLHGLHLLLQKETVEILNCKTKLRRFHEARQALSAAHTPSGARKIQKENHYQQNKIKNSAIS
jgi:hypothetical protein